MNSNKEAKKVQSGSLIDSRTAYDELGQIHRERFLIKNFFLCVVVLIGVFAWGERSVKVIEHNDFDNICLKNNPRVKASFEQELVTQLNNMNITTMRLAGAFPGECEVELHYTANWAWQVALYVSYIELKVIRNRSIIGYATYSTRDSVTPVGKLGSTSARITELLEAMFVNHRLKERGLERE